MEFILLSFVAGVLTVLTPCVLPLLPVIIGGSMAEKNTSRPVVIILALAGSILLFTFLLKVSSIFINVPQAFWLYLSATVISAFGLSLIFPNAWQKIANAIGYYRIGQPAQRVLHKQDTSSIWGLIVTGGALGPIFASCSPTFFFVLSTILPASLFFGTLNIISYILGLSLFMFIIAYGGQKIIRRLGYLANPKSMFKKSLGVLFVLVGIAVASGLDRKIEIALWDLGLGDLTKVELYLLEKIPEESIPKPVAELSGLNMIPNTIIKAGFLPTLIEIKNFFASKSDAPEAPVDAEKLQMKLAQSVGKVGELVGVENWINSEPIAALGDLKGKVVAVKFWTYTCINCIRTFDEVQALWEKYETDDFVLIGVHTPEFAFEKNIDNVRKEVKRYGLTFPVVQDNDFKTWRSFNNRYWPAFYLIDRDGVLRYKHFGEGKYREKDEAVAALLREHQG